ncbi:hypothetical protein [Microbulbifer sp. VAAF005]|uniref:hypothetical protein n=1 Tax=Microbulbifer sp. VAAF005 TaxID=3034230 RepID=UPI0024AE5311|nr:hypothetical protein [Microbulbifer sp. VAAF005]WHI45399.1 hypothetical protein P0078_16920 [Microbulbifer sp. VAAF005]
MRNLSISAFGKVFDLDQSQLAMLDGTIINGIQISSEAGYPTLGGETIYIKLFMGFTSGEYDSKYIIMSEESGLEIKSKLR